MSSPGPSPGPSSGPSSKASPGPSSRASPPGPSSRASPPGPSSRDSPGPSRPPGCTLSKLRSFVESSNLSEHLKHFRANSSVITVERHFRTLMRGIKFWELDRIQPLFSALCMLILCKEADTDFHCYKRSGLMARFMEFVDCVPPMIAHQLIEKLLEHLAEYEVDSEANLLKLAVKLADISYRGRVLAVCLLWWVLGRKLPALEITMHRFREPGELAEAIRKKPPTPPSAWLADENDMPIGEVQANMESLRVMLEAMERLLKLLLCSDNDELQDEGYPDHFFTLEDGDNIFLSEWCIDLSRELPASMCGPRGKFGAPLHGIITGLLQDRESKVVDVETTPLVVEPDLDVGIETPLVVETSESQDMDASLMVEVTLNVTDE